jgi:hypothetical protein
MSYKKSIAITLASLLVILSAGTYVLTKARSNEIQPSMLISSSSQSVISSQAISSDSKLIISSSSSQSQFEVVKVVETPKVESTSKGEEPKVVVDNPNEQVYDKAPSTKPLQTFSYEFNYSLSQIGGLPLTDIDISFLNENIADVADYYYNSVQPLFPNQKIYINSYGVQKQDDLNYLIAFTTTFAKDTRIDGPVPRIFSPKVFNFMKTNQHDGLFEEKYGLTYLNGNVLNSNQKIDIPNSEIIQDRHFDTFKIPDPIINHN